MKSATEAAVQQAVDIILTSLRNENHYTQNPTDHEDKCRKLDRQIDAVTLAMDAVTRTFERHLTQLRRERNTRSLFYSLPVELIIKILHEALEDSRHSSDWSTDIQNLSLVSFRLRQIFRNTPSFWAVIHIPDPLTNLPEALEKSKDHPLDVILVDSSDTPDETLITADFLQVGAHIHRWASADLYISEDNVQAIKILESPAPLLERLRIWITSSSNQGPNGTIIDLLCGDAKRLQHLSITGMAPREWSSPIFSELRTLSIKWPSNPQPSPHNLLMMLENSPLLEGLELSGVGWEGHVPKTSRPLVLLPKLQELDFNQVPPSTAEFLLNNIRAPYCFRSRMSVEYAVDLPDFALAEGLTPFVPAMSQILLDEARTGMDIRLGPSSIRVAEDTSEVVWGPACSVIILGLRPLRPLRWAIHAFQDVLLSRPLRVEVLSGLESEEDGVMEEMWRLDALTELEVQDAALDLGALFERLSHPFASERGRRWLFPNLRRLYIWETGFDEAALLRMVKSRNHDGVEPAPDQASPQLPVPIDRLHFSDLRGGAYKALEEIVGKGRVTLGMLPDPPDQH